jgi:hypothetical protein
MTNESEPGGLRVFTNETDTVVARSLQDAQVVVEQHYGATFEQEGWSLDEWSEVPGDTPITIRNVNGQGWDDKATRTASEWAMSDGRGFLCSTEW